MTSGPWPWDTCGVALPKEQPNAEEDQDDEDPDFDEKNEKWSLAMCLARHIQRRTSFRLSTCRGPAGNLSN